MNNFIIAIKRFFQNKNTVTIIGVLLIILVLFFGYRYQINKMVNPVSNIPVAAETIQPRTQITSDMIDYIETGDVITDGHLMLEVMSLNDKIGVTFEQVVNDTRYIEGFIRELEAEEIPYTLSGPFEKNMASFKLPK